jgi:hypothetical protein
MVKYGMFKSKVEENWGYMEISFWSRHKDRPFDFTESGRMFRVDSLRDSHWFRPNLLLKHWWLASYCFNRRWVRVLSDLWLTELFKVSLKISKQRRVEILLCDFRIENWNFSKVMSAHWASTTNQTGGMNWSVSNLAVGGSNSTESMELWPCRGHWGISSSSKTSTGRVTKKVQVLIFINDFSNPELSPLHKQIVTGEGSA